MGLTVGDIVEVIGPGIYKGDVGRIDRIQGVNLIYLRIGSDFAGPFCSYELRPSQQKLF